MKRKKDDTARMIAQEAALAEKDRDRAVPYKRVGRPPKPVGERGQVYSIRIPIDRIEELRLAAEAQDIAPAVLAREWILERLDDENRRKTSRVGDRRARHSRSDESAPSRRAEADRKEGQRD